MLIHGFLCSPKNQLTIRHGTDRTQRLIVCVLKLKQKKHLKTVNVVYAVFREIQSSW